MTNSDRQKSMGILKKHLQVGAELLDLLEPLFQDAPQVEAVEASEEFDSADAQEMVKRFVALDNMVTRLVERAREIDETLGNFGVRPPQVDAPLAQLRKQLSEVQAVLRGQQ